MAAIERVERDVRGSVVAILGVLATVQGVLGTWALVTPLVFYEGFPRVWVALLPPYNEYLVRDVGALNLALAAVLTGAALRADRATVRLAATAGLVAAVPHTAYHALYLSQSPPVDAVAQTIGTMVHLALLVVLLRLSARLEH